MSIFINIDNAFDKIKYLFLLKTFSKMGINTYFLKMKKIFFFSAKKQQFA